MMKNIESWKKAYESDIGCICTELRDLLEVPSVVILSGVVGSGKTTFTKQFLSQYQVASPTYSLVNEIGDTLHADLFRMGENDDITHLELGLYSEDKNFVLIEWGEKYLKEIEREIGEEFNYYRLRIEVGDKKSQTTQTRSYFLESY